MSEAEAFEQRLRAIEDFIAAERSRNEKVDELIDLLQKVKNALEVFVRIGNACKWLVGLGGSIAAVCYGIKQLFR